MVVGRQWKYFYSVADQREFLFDRINDPNETRNRANLRFTGKAKAEMKSLLIEHLLAEGPADALVEIDGTFDWKPFPKLDMSYLDDPDAELLFQDHDALVLDRKGYTD